MRLALLGLVALSVLCKTAVLLAGMYAYVYCGAGVWFLLGSWFVAVFLVPSEFRLAPRRIEED